MLSFIDQVAQFTKSIASRPAYMNPPWTGENALFGVWMGVNDVGNSWWLEDYETLLGKIMDSYFGQLAVLYEKGARKFALLTVPRMFPPPSPSFWSLCYFFFCRACTRGSWVSLSIPHCSSRQAGKE